MKSKRKGDVLKSNRAVIERLKFAAGNLNRIACILKWLGPLNFDQTRHLTLELDYLANTIKKLETK